MNLERQVDLSAAGHAGVTMTGTNQGLGYTTVPMGWNRTIWGDGSVVYVSPSGHLLHCAEDLQRYLLVEGTCKCGLECPLIIDRVFNFNPRVPARPKLPSDVLAESQHVNTLCKHRHKLVAMAVAMQGNEETLANVGPPGAGVVFGRNKAVSKRSKRSKSEGSIDLQHRNMPSSQMLALQSAHMHQFPGIASMLPGIESVPFDHRLQQQHSIEHQQLLQMQLLQMQQQEMMHQHMQQQLHQQRQAALRRRSHESHLSPVEQHSVDRGGGRMLISSPPLPCPNRHVSSAAQSTPTSSNPQNTTSRCSRSPRSSSELTSPNFKDRPVHNLSTCMYPLPFHGEAHLTVTGHPSEISIDPHASTVIPLQSNMYHAPNRASLNIANVSNNPALFSNPNDEVVFMQAESVKDPSKSTPRSIHVPTCEAYKFDSAAQPETKSKSPVSTSTDSNPLKTMSKATTMHTDTKPGNISFKDIFKQSLEGSAFPASSLLSAAARAQLAKQPQSPDSPVPHQAGDLMSGMGLFNHVSSEDTNKDSKPEKGAVIGSRSVQIAANKGHLTANPSDNADLTETSSKDAVRTEIGESPIQCLENAVQSLKNQPKTTCLVTTTTEELALESIRVSSASRKRISSGSSEETIESCLKRTRLQSSDSSHGRNSIDHNLAFLEAAMLTHQVPTTNADKLLSMHQCDSTKITGPYNVVCSTGKPTNLVKQPKVENLEFARWQQQQQQQEWYANMLRSKQQQDAGNITMDHFVQGPHMRPPQAKSRGLQELQYIAMGGNPHRMSAMQQHPGMGHMHRFPNRFMNPQCAPHMMHHGHGIPMPFRMDAPMDQLDPNVSQNPNICKTNILHSMLLQQQQQQQQQQQKLQHLGMLPHSSFHHPMQHHINPMHLSDPSQHIPPTDIPNVPPTKGSSSAAPKGGASTPRRKTTKTSRSASSTQAVDFDDDEPKDAAYWIKAASKPSGVRKVKDILAMTRSLKKHNSEAGHVEAIFQAVLDSASGGMKVVIKEGGKSQPRSVSESTIVEQKKSPQEATTSVEISESPCDGSEKDSENSSDQTEQREATEGVVSDETISPRRVLKSNDDGNKNYIVETAEQINEHVGTSIGCSDLKTLNSEPLTETTVPSHQEGLQLENPDQDQMTSEEHSPCVSPTETVQRFTAKKPCTEVENDDRSATVSEQEILPSLKETFVAPDQVPPGNNLPTEMTGNPPLTKSPSYVVSVEASQILDKSTDSRSEVENHEIQSQEPSLETKSSQNRSSGKNVELDETLVEDTVSSAFCEGTQNGKSELEQATEATVENNVITEINQIVPISEGPECEPVVKMDIDPSSDLATDHQEHVVPREPFTNIDSSSPVRTWSDEIEVLNTCISATESSDSSDKQADNSGMESDHRCSRPVADITCGSTSPEDIVSNLVSVQEESPYGSPTVSPSVDLQNKYVVDQTDADVTDSSQEVSLEQNSKLVVLSTDCVDSAPESELTDPNSSSDSGMETEQPKHDLSGVLKQDSGSEVTQSEVTKSEVESLSTALLEASSKQAIDYRPVEEHSLVADQSEVENPTESEPENQDPPVDNEPVKSDTFLENLSVEPHPVLHSDTEPIQRTEEGISQPIQEEIADVKQMDQEVQPGTLDEIPNSDPVTNELAVCNKPEVVLERPQEHAFYPKAADQGVLVEKYTNQDEMLDTEPLREPAALSELSEPMDACVGIEVFNEPQKEDDLADSRQIQAVNNEPVYEDPAMDIVDMEVHPSQSSDSAREDAAPIREPPAYNEPMKQNSSVDEAERQAQSPVSEPLNQVHLTDTHPAQAMDTEPVCQDPAMDTDHIQQDPSSNSVFIKEDTRLSIETVTEDALTHKIIEKDASQESEMVTQNQKTFREPVSQVCTVIDKDEKPVPNTMLNNELVEENQLMNQSDHEKMKFEHLETTSSDNHFENAPSIEQCISDSKVLETQDFPDDAEILPQDWFESSESLQVPPCVSLNQVEAVDPKPEEPGHTCISPSHCESNNELALENKPSEIHVVERTLNEQLGLEHIKQVKEDHELNELERHFDSKDDSKPVESLRKHPIAECIDHKLLDSETPMQAQLLVEKGEEVKELPTTNTYVHSEDLHQNNEAIIDSICTQVETIETSEVDTSCEENLSTRQGSSDEHQGNQDVHVVPEDGNVSLQSQICSSGSHVGVTNQDCVTSVTVSENQSIPQHECGVNSECSAGKLLEAVTDFTVDDKCTEISLCPNDDLRNSRQTAGDSEIVLPRSSPVLAHGTPMELSSETVHSNKSMMENSAVAENEPLCIKSDYVLQDSESEVFNSCEMKTVSALLSYQDPLPDRSTATCESSNRESVSASNGLPLSQGLQDISTDFQTPQGQSPSNPIEEDVAEVKTRSGSDDERENRENKPLTDESSTQDVCTIRREPNLKRSVAEMQKGLLNSKEASFKKDRLVQESSTRVLRGNVRTDPSSEFSSSMFPRHLEIGDLVWGPIRGYPSWPGKLVSEAEVRGRSRREEGKMWVRWFGDHSCTQVEPDKLKTLSEGLEAHHSARQSNRRGRRMNSTLEAAIQEAMNELDKKMEQAKESKSKSVPKSARPRARCNKRLR